MAEPARKVEVEYEGDGRSDDGDFSSGDTNDSQSVSDPGAPGIRGFSKDRSHYLRDRLAQEIKTKNESLSAYLEKSSSFLEKISSPSTQNSPDLIKKEITNRSTFVKEFTEFQLAVKTLEVELEKMKRNTWENHGGNQHLEKLEVERRRLLNPSRGYYAPDEFILKKLEKEIIGIKRDEKRHSKEVFSQTSGSRYDNQLILNQEHLVTEAKKMMVDFYRNDRALQNAFSRRIPQPKAPINDTDHATSVPQYDNKTAEAPALETDTEAPYTPPAYQPSPYTATPSSLGTGGFVAPPGPTNSFGAANDNQPSQNRPSVTTQQSGDRQTAARSTTIAPGANDNSPAQPGASKVTAIPSSKNTSVASRTPRNTSPVRKVETEYSPETRPRDAAIRQNRAANDTYRAPANDNARSASMRPTTDQIFLQSYEEASVGSTFKTQLDERAPDGEPQRTSRFSEQQNISRVSTTASETSTIVRAVGRSKGIRSAAERVQKLEGKAETAGYKLLAKSLHRTNLAWGMSVYVALQLPVALTSLVFLSFFIAAGTIEAAAKAVTGGFIYDGIKFVAQKVAEVAGAVLGFDASAFDPESAYVAMSLLAFLIGLSTMLIMGIMYQLATINSLFGRGATVKIAAFIVCMAGYLFPVFNLVPWFAVWSWSVSKYPK